MPRVQLSMVIDLHACVGCSACDIACKRENNVPESFAWSNHIIETSGTFPNLKYRYIPTLCNHCSDAPCVEVCPTTAMHKEKNGITMHDADKCIGCASCRIACPYNVIYYNKNKPHEHKDKELELIPQCTASEAEVEKKAGFPMGYYNPAREKTLPGIRPKGVVEKCTFCDHRISEGEEPACVEACPADARIFGNRMDPTSKVSQLLAKYHPRVLKPSKGTRPNVFYIREY
ncbi:MAG: 4Fe-4S dicluster domain-containing protein [Calditrichia bacterium]